MFRSFASHLIHDKWIFPWISFGATVSELVRAQPIEGLSDQVLDLVRASRAPSTLAAYAADWRRFERWCTQTQRAKAPASAVTLAEYLGELVKRGLRPSTIDRARVAIGQAHTLRGLPSPANDPLINELMKGLRRTLGVAQREARPLAVEELRAVVEGQPTTEMGLRNRALLVLGFMGALRRSEIVALNVDDVVVERRGLVLTIRKSKTDQEGRGARIGLPAQRGNVCPVKVFEAWRASRSPLDVVDDALFVSLGRRGRGRRLHDQAVWRILREAAERANVDGLGLSAHSLRAGFATAAAKAGKPESATRRVTRHRSIAMLLKYVRIDDPLDAAAGDSLLDS